jgi:hypothetical protein
MVMATLPCSAAVLRVNAGGDLQQALNAARPGDTVELQAGATFPGSFTLPVNTGTGYVTVQTSAVSKLPVNARVKPSSASNMAALVAPDGGAALIAATGAHHFRFIGLEIRPAAGTYSFGLVLVGLGSETTVAELPHDLEFDRMYIHGDPEAGTKRGIALNGAAVTVRNSYISDIKSNWQEAQALCGWNGPGPFTIINNYLEGSGENVMFGGAWPAIPGLVPSDILVRGNYLFKPTSWRAVWGVKNLFELKNARNVVLDGNILENCWPGWQSGLAILFNGGVDGPQSIIENVQVTNNLIRNASLAFSIGSDNVYNQTTPPRQMTFRNNLMTGLAGSTFMLLGRLSGVTIEHNTAISENTSYSGEESAVFANATFRSNIFIKGAYGFIGNGTPDGLETLNRYFPGFIFSDNAMVGSSPAVYPQMNFFPASVAEFGFANTAANNYRLSPAASVLFRGSDGKDVGVNMSALDAALQTARTGYFR